MITIDDKNIKEEWGLEPLYGNYYDNLMIFPSIKTRISEAHADEDGTEVMYGQAYKAEQKVSIKFIFDTISGYKSFMRYMIDNNSVVLYDSEIDRSFTLAYLSCSSFDYYDTYGVFGIKVRLS